MTQYLTPVVPTSVSVTADDWQSGHVYTLATSEEADDIQKRAALPDVFDPDRLGYRYLVAWNGHEFETPVGTASVRTSTHINNTIKANLRYDLHPGPYKLHRGPPREYTMEVYFPLDPRMRLIDVQGATIAYPNEANNGWLFAHTDEGTHHDYELTLLAAIDGVFQPLFRQYQSDIYTSANDGLVTLTKQKFSTLSTFYGAVIAKARAFARGLHLGERHQQPHPKVGYLDADITRAVAAVKAEWADSAAAMIIASALTYIDNSLTMPTPETRWDKEARIKREAEELAEAQDEEGE